MSIEYCNCKYGGSPSSYHDNCLSCNKLIKTIYIKYDELEKKLEIAVEALRFIRSSADCRNEAEQEQCAHVAERTLAAIKGDSNE